MTVQSTEIYGVLDLKDGHVVHAVRGERASYRPVRSTITPSSAPLDVARAFRDTYGIGRLYVADLDAILGVGSHADAVAELTTDGFDVLLDPGVRRLEEARSALALGVGRVALALETVPSPELLREWIRVLTPERVVFSLDLRDGVPLGDRLSWGDGDAQAVAAQAIECGATQILVLDLATVGARSGPATLELAGALARRHPEICWLAGGGVRDRDDVAAFMRTGVRGVLVATALHAGW